MWWPELVAFISMPRDEPPFRAIRSQDEVRRVLESFIGSTHRIFFGLPYADGLRISEAIALETHVRRHQKLTPWRHER